MARYAFGLSYLAAMIATDLDRLQALERRCNELTPKTRLWQEAYAEYWDAFRTFLNTKHDMLQQLAHGLAELKLAQDIPISLRKPPEPTGWARSKKLAAGGR